MTNILYVHNFRGFSNTFIPLKSVNFFVGENSTGKTSIISLIALIGSPEFWIRQDFNTDIVQLGSFKDIISFQHKELKFFQIGFIVPIQNGKYQHESYEAVLMTFEEKDNSPIITRYNYVSKEGQAKILFLGNQIKYTFAHLETESSDFERISGIFKAWTTESKPNLDEYKPLQKEGAFQRNRALLFVERVLQQIHGESATKPDNHVFEVKVPEFSARLAWLAPIRSKPRRTYDEYKLDFSPEGDHTPYLIKRLLKHKKGSKEFRNFLEKFGVESGLFDSLETKGFGKEAASPFELRVVLDKIPLALINVGYGVAQALPVVVELFARPQTTQFAIQQPEVHLHPKAQAALGDVIFRLAQAEKKIFYVETHSDYTIDRFRLNYRKNNNGAPSQVLFFERTPEGNHVYPINIVENGEYSENQPDKFREFFIREELNLLGL